MTQTDAANQIGANQSTWSSWERSVTLPFQRRHVEPLAVVLGMLAGDLEKLIDHDLRTVPTLRDFGKPSVNRALIRDSVSPERGSRKRVAEKLGISYSSVVNHAANYFDYFNDPERIGRVREDHLNRVPVQETMARELVGAKWIYEVTKDLPRRGRKKFTEAEELAVCAEYPAKSMKALAAEYGCSGPGIGHILRRRGVQLVDYYSSEAFVPSRGRQRWPDPNRWARDWGACQKCAETGRRCKDTVRGLCGRCLSQEYDQTPGAKARAKEREAVRTAKRKEARKH